MFPIAQQHVANVVLVSDEAIRTAQQVLWDVLRVVAEPGAAAPLAALLSGRHRFARSERTGVLVCGGNTTAVNFDLTRVPGVRAPAPPAQPGS
jgi:threonine dehydratase